MTIEFNGTGGIIEGDFGTADINVNLDPAIEFDGTNDYLRAATGTDEFRASDNTGTITAWIKSNNWQSADQCVFCVSDEAGGSHYLKVVVRNDGKLWVRWKSDGGTTHDCKSTNTLKAGA